MVVCKFGSELSHRYLPQIYRVRTSCQLAHTSLSSDQRGVCARHTPQGHGSIPPPPYDSRERCLQLPAPLHERTLRHCLLGSTRGQLQQSQTVRATLCRLLVKMQATDVLSLLVTKAPETLSKTMNLMSFFSEHKVSNSVAAVAAVGDLRALRSALRGDADYTWETSHQSGFLLAAAAAVGGYGEIVRATDSRCDERLRIEVQLTEMIERRQYYKRPTAPTDNFAAGAADLFPLKQNETSVSMVLVE